MSDHRTMPVLPVEAYTSQEWFDREQERIFSRTWACVGFAEHISEPGQYVSVQAGLNNIFVVMGRDRRLRAFHNICRHRGTQLLRAVGQTQRAIVCPYHDWTYDLEGCLISVPEQERQFPGQDLTCIRLKQASVDLWRGMLWVHPEENAGSIMEWFGEVEPHLGPHKVEELIEYPEGRTEHIIAANWKIVVENYIDGYHLAHLHSGTLAMYDHSRIRSSFVGTALRLLGAADCGLRQEHRKKRALSPGDPAGAGRRLGADAVSRHRSGRGRKLVDSVSCHSAGPRPHARGHPQPVGQRTHADLRPAGESFLGLLGWTYHRQVRGRCRRPHGVG